MSKGLNRTNFWTEQAPYEVHRSAQRVMAQAGLIDSASLTANHGNNLGSCNCGGDCNSHCGGCEAGNCR